VPAVAITTDVIVGFPGETDKEFEESLEFCKQLGFARIHVFSYSPRSGTAAAKMAKPGCGQGKEGALQADAGAGGRKRKQFPGEFHRGSTGCVMGKQTDDGDWTGMTGNYIRVYAKSKDNLRTKNQRLRFNKQVSIVKIQVSIIKKS